MPPDTSDPLLRPNVPAAAPADTTGPHDPAARRRLRRAVLALAAILPLQYALAAWPYEPWPLVTMPSFMRVYEGDALYRVRTARVVVTDTEGARHELPLARLFEAAPRQQHLRILERQMQPRALADRAFPPALVRLRDALGADRDPERLDLPETRAWLRQRAEALLPGVTPAAVAVVWSDDTHRPGEPLRRVLLDSLTAPL